MIEIEFDFQRYIAERRGDIEQRARDGATYAYSGESKVRRPLGSTRPVVIALEATTRLWKSTAKKELLTTSVAVTDKQFPQVFKAVQRAAQILRMSPPAVYIAPGPSAVRAAALGTNDDAYLVINAQIADGLSDSELLALIGQQLGHLQNNHVLYATALHYLTTNAAVFVRWAVQPAIMTLQLWSRRAEITCDRAALLCTKDLHIALSAIVKVALRSEDGKLAVSVDDYLQNLPESKRGVGRYAELFRSHPHLPKRVEALRVFAESALYKKAIGADTTGALSMDDVDAKVAEIVSVF